MTQPARITQSDMERATKAVKAAGYTRARIIFDLAARRIEVIVGDEEPEPHHVNPWDADLPK